MKAKKTVVNSYHITRSNIPTYSHQPSCFSFYLLREEIKPEHILDATKKILVALILKYFYFSKKVWKVFEIMEI